MSQITTHVLDTSMGKPASGVPVTLHRSTGQDQWEKLGHSITNSDGRAPSLLSDDQKLAAGVYKITFETKVYFDKTSTKSFYPYVTVVFEIQDATHHHVPLLLSPFGYSTYRGS